VPSLRTPRVRATGLCRLVVVVLESLAQPFPTPDWALGAGFLSQGTRSVAGVPDPPIR
jgi:hypothetical protein